MSTHHSNSSHSKSLLKLSLGALGVVYGDIGTSPLYAIKESFHPAHGLPLSIENIFGILSLVFWSLMLVVTIKYLAFILRADKQGEGGITTLMALLLPSLKDNKDARLRTAVVFLGLSGAGLLYGDGIITPAISVLSAIEGLQVATPAFNPYVVPITVAILLLLFSQQKRGTAKLGAVFGLTTLIWFVTLAAIGLPWVLKRPEILQAMNPIFMLRFFEHNGVHGFLVLGSIVLCITGGEALYADMGHFGKRPIRLSWFAIVLPALLINYFGQGALVLEKGTGIIENTFYGLVEGWAIYPLVVIATLAAVIASQALISGAFSLTQQTMQLGFLPRTEIHHTSRETKGQIYIPKVNQFLAVGCIALVLNFQSSTNLAAAYGIAVTATMTITTILFYLVCRRLWKWPLLPSLALTSLFIAVDLAFFGASAVKIMAGGWIPAGIALAIFAVMTTWKRGRRHLAGIMGAHAVSLADFFAGLHERPIHRNEGTAVFLTLTSDIAPNILTHHIRHTHCLHERVILISIMTEAEPEVSGTARVRVTELEQGFFKVIARYGYMETPDIAEILASCEAAGLPITFAKTSFYLGREVFLLGGECEMATWRKKLFIFLSKNAKSASEFFRLPANQVVEIGSQIRL